MFAGLWTLIRLILRRDRFKLPIWVASVVLSLLSMVPLLKSVYGDTASIELVYQGFTANPAGLFLTGPMDAPTFGAFMTIETVLWWGLAIAFMNTLFIVRHTRQNEEIGAQELILSGQTHRATGMVAALIVAFFVNLVMAVSIGVGLSVMGSEGNPWLYGIAFGVFGLAWAGIASLVVQLTENARVANGILASLIGGAFLLRGIGDFIGKINDQGVIEAAWPSSLSPFGWMQVTRALTFPEWSPLLIPILFTAAIIPIAFFLLSHRDVGAGIIPSRAGRSHASRFLKTSFGLTWKLQKNIFIGWLIGVIVTAGTIGSLIPMMGSVYEESEQLKHMIAAMGGTGAIIPSFLAAMLSIIVLMSLAYVLQALGKMRSEETYGYLEQLLATRVSRVKWLGLHSGFVIVGGVVLPIVAGMIMSVSTNVASDVVVDIGSYTAAGLAYAPVIVLFAGMYLALFGLLPRVAGIVCWVYFGFVAFSLWIAPLLQIDDWITNLSVLSHVAAAPVEKVEWPPLIGLGLAAIALLVVGYISFQKRDAE